MTTYGLSFINMFSQPAYRCFDSAGELIQYVRQARCLSTWKPGQASVLVFKHDNEPGQRLRIFKLSK